MPPPLSCLTTHALSLARACYLVALPFSVLLRFATPWKRSNPPPLAVNWAGAMLPLATPYRLALRADLLIFRLLHCVPRSDVATHLFRYCCFTLSSCLLRRSRPSASLRFSARADELQERSKKPFLWFGIVSGFFLLFLSLLRLISAVARTLTKKHSLPQAHARIFLFVFLSNFTKN